MRFNLRKIALLGAWIGTQSIVSAAVSNATFRPQEIDAKIQIGYGVAAADVNGDGRLDVILVDKKQIVWYENPTWAKHVIAENLTSNDHVCLAARDIDGDGKCELAVGAGWNPGDTLTSGAVFYLDPPADRAQRWKVVPLPHEPTVHRMRWVRNAQGGFDLIVVPLHGRGNTNGQGAGVKILAYHRPKVSTEPWRTEVLDDSLHITHNFDPVAWDRDAEDELLVAGREGVHLLDRSNGHSTLTRLSGAESGGAGEVRLGTFRGGKRYFATIEPWHGTNLVIYTSPPEGQRNALWTRHVVDSSLVDGHAVACGDLLHRGDDQVVVGWRAMNKPGVKVGIRLYLPSNATGENWERIVVDDNTMACEDLCLADLNGDGRLDIVAAGRATKNVIIYFNESTR